MTKLCVFLLICSLTIVSAGTVYSSDSGSLYSAPALTDLGTDQGNPVTGTVKDAATGELLAGATVFVKGTTTGQLTDISGHFSIRLPEREAILVFSFIGFTPQEIKATEGTVVNVALALEVTVMDEVVVIGYGVQKKESVVGSITQVTGADIVKSVNGADLTNALSGNLPGVITLQTTGIPGGSGPKQTATEIFIRGQKTWNNSAPLILVDGIERGMSDVDPYTIEKISVLKDASATAVFGVKGANGVILITTQRGQEGKPQFSFRETTTLKSVSRVKSQLGSYETLKTRNIALLNEVMITPSSWNSMMPQEWLEYYRIQAYPDYLVDVNWAEEFTKDFALDQNVNMSVSGGTKVVKYFGSLSYLNEGDIMKNQDYGQGYDPSFKYERLNFRSNLDFDITPTTRFSTNIAGFIGTQRLPRGFSGQTWYGLYGAPPDAYPVRYSDGTWGDWTIDERYSNEIIMANFSGYTLSKVTQVNTDFELNQKLDFIIKGLSANAKLSYDNTANTAGPNLLDDGIMTKYIYPTIMEEIVPGMTDEQIKALEAKYIVWNMPKSWSRTAGYDYTSQPNGNTAETATTASGEALNVYRSLNYQFSLNYLRDFGKHAVSGLVLMSRNERATGSVFPSYREDWVGRVTYSYDKRYLFEFNGAYNGSEKFARKYRFGFFPSMAVGWVISNEPYFKKYTSVVNNLKLRLSNGKVGSDAGIDRWLYTGSYDVTNTKWRFGAPYTQTSYPITSEGVIPNPDIQWEISEKTDFGVEAGFFKNLITINFDYYWENRTNIFISGTSRNVPSYFGASAVAANLGQVKNHGWELESKFSRTTPGGFNYWVSCSWAFAVDKVINRDDPELMPTYQKQAGFAIGQPKPLLNQPTVMNTWNDVYTGVLTESNSNILPGDFHMIDFNSDGVINTYDGAPFGYTNRPQYSYAPKIGVAWKGISAGLEFYGTYNVEGETKGVYTSSFMDGQSILYPWDRDLSWSPELGVGTDAVYPGLRYSTNKSSGTVYTSRSALRLRHAEISYILSSSYIKKMGISNLRFTLSGDNLILWSDMRSDFEDSSLDVSGTYQVQRSYPRLKRVNFGVSFNFQ